ncbi:MAG TPA: hypothetical protein VIT43_01580 [Candidatus Dormibacteraeota bacterium]
MTKSVRIGFSLLSGLALAGVMAISGIQAGAAETAAAAAATIGVDNATPSGHNFEYIDFFPRDSAIIRDDSTVGFQWNAGSPDGFHTATLLPADSSPTPATWGGNNSLVTPDEAADGNQLQINPAVIAPSQPGCGFGPQAACTYDGSQQLNSGALPTSSGASFRVHVFLDASAPTTLHFVCLIHHGMQGSLTVLPADYEGPLQPSTSASLATASSAQYAADNVEAFTAESAANNKAVATNSDGTHTITMSAGTASQHVEVAEMLPSRVEIRPGDHVKWTTGTRADIHTVTFPQGDNPQTEPIPFVCESTSGADTNATAPGPGGCSNPAGFEIHFNPAPVGPTVISSTSTVASSGIIANPPAPFPTTYTFTFSNSGSFAYQCRIHDHMVGTIVVNPAQAAANPPVLAQTGGRSSSMPWWPAAVGFLLVLIGVAGLRFRFVSRR